jgi:hypothetical protein
VCKALVRNKRGTGEAQSGARVRGELSGLFQTDASQVCGLATFGQPSGKGFYILVVGRTDRQFLLTRQRSGCRVEGLLSDGLIPDASSQAAHCVADREGMHSETDVRTKGGLFGRHRHELRSR